MILRYKIRIWAELTLKIDPTSQYLVFLSLFTFKLGVASHFLSLLLYWK